MLVEAAGSVGRMHGKQLPRRAARPARQAPRAQAGRRSRSRTRSWSPPTACSTATSPTGTSAPTGSPAATTEAHTRRLVAQLEAARPHRRPRPRRLTHRGQPRRRAPPDGAHARAGSPIHGSVSVRARWGEAADRARLIASASGARETAAVADDLAPGLYEELVSAALVAQLASIEDPLVERIALRPADAADRIAQHLARELMRAIDAVPEAERVATGIEVARRLIDEIAQRLPRSGASSAMPADPVRVLAAIGEWQPDGTRPYARPADDPAARHHAAHQRTGRATAGQPDHGDRIGRSDRRRDGVHPAQRHPAAARRPAPPLRPTGAPLRVLTTTYTGSTERAALDQLADLGADVRVSYDTPRPASTPRRGCSTAATGILDGVHRVVEPHPLGPGHRPGMERRVSGLATPT